MLLLSDGETIYLIHDGMTRVYKNPCLTSVNEEHRTEKEPMYTMGNPRNYRVGRTSHSATINLMCEGVEVIDKELDLEISKDLEEGKEVEEINLEDMEEDIINSMTIREVLDIFNQKVNERRDTDGI